MWRIFIFGLVHEALGDALRQSSVQMLVATTGSVVAVQPTTEPVVATTLSTALQLGSTATYGK